MKRPQRFDLGVRQPLTGVIYHNCKVHTGQNYPANIPHISAPHFQVQHSKTITDIKTKPSPPESYISMSPIPRSIQNVTESLTMPTHNILVLPGDGVGPEIVRNNGLFLLFHTSRRQTLFAHIYSPTPDISSRSTIYPVCSLNNIYHEITDSRCPR